MRPWSRAAWTHSVCACLRRLVSPSGAMRTCGLIACSRYPQRGQRYVAGLRFWAARTDHQAAGSSFAIYRVRTYASATTEPSGLRAVLVTRSTTGSASSSTTWSFRLTWPR